MPNHKLKYAFILLPILLVFLGQLLGSVTLPLSRLLDPHSPASRIFFELRLPRTILALVAGGSLAMLGGTYQVLFRNPLAEPYILGVASAATLGAAIGETFLHISAYSLQGVMIAFLSAMVVSLLLVSLCFSKAGQEMERIVLFGMGINFVLSSCLFLFLSYYHQQMGGGSLRWLFGQIPWISWRELGLYLLLSMSLTLSIFILARHLDALALGDGVARTLGFSPARERSLLVILTSAVLSVTVSLTGAIGFVGLVVPHAVRFMFRPSTSRSLLGGCLLLGSAFLVLSDIVSRILLPPLEFPIGVITTLLGGPLFLVLLWRR